MTKLAGTAKGDNPRFGRGREPRHAAGTGRWVNPLLGVLGAVVLSGYLLTGYPSPLAPATDESTVSSVTDLLKVAFAAAIALAWAVGGVWLGMPRVRQSNFLSEPTEHARTTGYPTHAAYESPRAPTYDRMYDETRLVPQYIRSIEFPATKHELVRLAKEHTDEGQALRRLECIPDCRYHNLHDLIIEFRID